jgi:tetratricopeptide (TPR) repeat protein
MIPIRFFALCAFVFVTSAEAAEPIKWRTNYDEARKEATEKNLPLLVDVQTTECFYCRKMEATTFVDPAFATLVQSNFIPLKIDGNKDRELATALRVQIYPTLVLAGPDGKIHAFLQGYLTADQCSDHLKRTALAVSTPDWIARDLELAGKAAATAEYPKAVGLLNAIIADGKSHAAVEKAKQVLGEIEAQAAQSLAAARKQEQAGDLAGASKAFSELTKQYAGTKAAFAASTQLANMVNRPSAIENVPSGFAKDLLAAAREEFRTNRFAESLELCERLTSVFPNSVEARDASILRDQIKSDPDRLTLIVARQQERTASLYLDLADSWTKKGQTKEAAACLDTVIKLTPGTKLAAAAQTRLANLPVKSNAVQAEFKK